MFSELSGRLLPFYSSYEKIRQLVDKCDEMSTKLNPLVPIGQIYNPPSWINGESLDLGVKVADGLQLDLLESEFNGKILVLKNSNSLHSKVFDLDLMELQNDILTGKG